MLLLISTSRSWVFRQIYLFPSSCLKTTVKTGIPWILNLYMVSNNVFTSGYHTGYCWNGTLWTTYFMQGTFPLFSSWGTGRESDTVDAGEHRKDKSWSQRHTMSSLCSDDELKAKTYYQILEYHSVFWLSFFK